MIIYADGGLTRVPRTPEQAPHALIYWGAVAYMPGLWREFAGVQNVTQFGGKQAIPQVDVQHELLAAFNAILAVRRQLRYFGDITLYTDCTLVQSVYFHITNPGSRGRMAVADLLAKHFKLFPSQAAAIAELQAGRIEVRWMKGSTNNMMHKRAHYLGRRLRTSTDVMPYEQWVTRQQLMFIENGEPVYYPLPFTGRCCTEAGHET